MPPTSRNTVQALVCVMCITSFFLCSTGFQSFQSNNPWLVSVHHLPTYLSYLCVLRPYRSAPLLPCNRLQHLSHRVNFHSNSPHLPEFRLNSTQFASSSSSPVIFSRFSSNFQSNSPDFVEFCHLQSFSSHFLIVLPSNLPHSWSAGLSFDLYTRRPNAKTFILRFLISRSILREVKNEI